MEEEEEEEEEDVLNGGAENLDPSFIYVLAIWTVGSLSVNYS